MMLLKHRKLMLSLAIVMFVLLLLLGCTNEGSEAEQTSETDGDAETSVEAEEAEDPITIKVGYIAGPEESYALGFVEYAEAVTEATDGRVKFDIYGGGELGGEREVIEQTTLGTVDMTLATTAPLAGFVPEVNVFDFPFLFEDEAHAYAALDGEVGQELLDRMEQANLKGIAFWENGFRHITNTKRAVRSPEDMTGLKMRSMESEITAETFKALGADPVPIAFPELYTSIEQGVIDGHDNSYNVLEGTGIYEVTDYLSDVGIYYASASLVMNMDTFQSLPEDIQKTIVQLGKEYAIVQRKINQEKEAEQRVIIEESGMEIVDAADVDMEAFREAVETVYEDYWDEYGDDIERIRETK